MVVMITFFGWFILFLFNLFTSRIVCPRFLFLNYFIIFYLIFFKEKRDEYLPLHCVQLRYFYLTEITGISSTSKPLLQMTVISFSSFSDEMSSSTSSELIRSSSCSNAEISSMGVRTFMSCCLLISLPHFLLYYSTAYFYCFFSFIVTFFAKYCNSLCINFHFTNQNLNIFKY